MRVVTHKHTMSKLLHLTRHKRWVEQGIHLLAITYLHRQKVSQFAQVGSIKLQNQIFCSDLNALIGQSYFWRLFAKDLCKI